MVQTRDWGRYVTGYLHQKSSLERQFIEESFQAPGPDGFYFSFINKAWKIIKEDVKVFFKEFHKNWKGLNSTFIALVPQIDEPLHFQDFRPISMVGCMYNILSKVLAARFQKVLPSLIGEPQSTFIGGRQVLDGVLIANEMIDGRPMIVLARAS